MVKKNITIASEDFKQILTLVETLGSMLQDVSVDKSVNFRKRQMSKAGSVGVMKVHARFVRLLE